jgi:Domain of unknown function (DUF4338)
MRGCHLRSTSACGLAGGVQTVLRYRGRSVEPDDVAFIRDLIATHSGASRRALSIELCRAWDWVQPNGAVRDMVCRGLLLALHRAGHIELPAPRVESRAAWMRRAPAPVVVDTTPIECSLRELGEIALRQVRRTADEPLVGALIAQHHYLGYRQPVGEHLKYLVTARERPIGCFLWSSAPRHLAPRDTFIGWQPETRKRNLRFVAYQTRFLILPWVRVPHLASHLLARMNAQLSTDWQMLYAHPIYFTETFVDPERNRGTCYRAANWTVLGLTKGRGNNDRTNRPNRSLKLLFGYPLVRDFQRRLCADIGAPEGDR